MVFNSKFGNILLRVFLLLFGGKVGKMIEPANPCLPPSPGQVGTKGRDDNE